MHLKHTCFTINLKFQKGTFIHLAQQEVHVHRSGWTPSNSHAPTNATCIGYVYKTMSFVCGSDFPLFFFNWYYSAQTWRIETNWYHLKYQFEWETIEFQKFVLGDGQQEFVLRNTGTFLGEVSSCTDYDVRGTQ